MLTPKQETFDPCVWVVEMLDPHGWCQITNRCFLFQAVEAIMHYKRTFPRKDPFPYRIRHAISDEIIPEEILCADDK